MYGLVRAWTGRGDDIVAMQYHDDSECEVETDIAIIDVDTRVITCRVVDRTRTGHAIIDDIAVAKQHRVVGRASRPYAGIAANIVAPVISAADPSYDVIVATIFTFPTWLHRIAVPIGAIRRGGAVSSRCGIVLLRCGAVLVFAVLAVVLAVVRACSDGRHAASASPHRRCVRAQPRDDARWRACATRDEK